MRRAPLAALALLVACATPEIRLEPRFRVGEQRVYRLAATATTTVRLAGREQRETTDLRARSRLEVLGIDGAETTVRLTLTPDALTRDGATVTPPAEQVAELVVGSDGSVLRVLSVGGLPAELVGADIQDLAPVLGSPMPSGRVRVGERWVRTLPPPAVQRDDGPLPTPEPGRQSGRVAGLRVVEGFDCAIVSLATRRPLVRERPVGEQTVSLTGVETSATELAFAFREGLPVEIRTTAEGRFDVGAGSFTGGTIEIRTEMTLTLLSPSA